VGRLESDVGWKPNGVPIVRKLTRYLRYPRILLNTTAAVLCVLIVAVWVVSYFAWGYLAYHTGPDGDGASRLFMAEFEDAQLALTDHTYPATVTNNRAGFGWNADSSLVTHSWSHYWFHAGAGVFPEDTSVKIPFWPLLLPPLLWTIFVIQGYRRKRRWARLGLCAKCGYDLRGSTSGGPGGRCPECGTPIPASYQPPEGVDRLIG
jgi:hypothetical protein